MVTATSEYLSFIYGAVVYVKGIVNEAQGTGVNHHKLFFFLSLHTFTPLATTVITFPQKPTGDTYSQHFYPSKAR